MLFYKLTYKSVKDGQMDRCLMRQLAHDSTFVYICGRGRSISEGLSPFRGFLIMPTRTMVAFISEILPTQLA